MGGPEILLVILILLITQIPAFIIYRRSKVWQRMYNDLSKKIFDKTFKE